MVNAVHCIFRRLRLKHGIDLGAHQLRRPWTTNFRRLGVGDPYDLQRERGWEDLETPHRFYVNSERDKPGRPSVLDSWEFQRRSSSGTLDAAGSHHTCALSL